MLGPLKVIQWSKSCASSLAIDFSAAAFSFSVLRRACTGAASHSHSHPPKNGSNFSALEKGQVWNHEPMNIRRGLLLTYLRTKCPQTSPRLIKFHCLSDFLYALMKISLLGLHMVFMALIRILCASKMLLARISATCSSHFRSPAAQCSCPLGTWICGPRRKQCKKASISTLVFSLWHHELLGHTISLNLFTFRSIHLMDVISFQEISCLAHHLHVSTCYDLEKKTCRVMPGHSGASPFSTKQLFIPRFQLQQFVLKLRGFDPQVGGSY